MNDSKNSMERCVLCLNEKRSPVRVQCGHSFCSGCLDVYKSYKRYPWASKCPICRDVLKEKRGTTKRKYSETNTTAQDIPIDLTTETDRSPTSPDSPAYSPSPISPDYLSYSPSSPRYLPNSPEQNNSFEEFMAMAFDVYESMDEPGETNANRDEDFYYGGDEEAPSFSEADDSSQDELDTQTDLDGVNDYEDSDDDERNYFSLDEDEDSDQISDNGVYVCDYHSPDYDYEEVDTELPRDYSDVLLGSPDVIIID